MADTQVNTLEVLAPTSSDTLIGERAGEFKRFTLGPLKQSEDNAHASELAAGASATAAAAARAQAEAARDAANASGRAYTSAQGSASGLADAGVAIGQTFSVVAADLLSYAVYRKDAGPIATPLFTQSTKAYMDALVRGSSDQTQHWQRWSDDGGFVTALFDALSLRAGGASPWSVGPAGLDTPAFTLQQESTLARFRLKDEFGFSGVYLDGQAYAGLSASLNSMSDSVGLHAQTFDIVADKPGTSFAVTDGSGYFSVWVGAGQAAGDTAQLASDVAALKRGSNVSIAAPIPTSGLAVWAHRGVTINGAAPEDSLDAVYLAARMRFKHVEADIQKTSDGVYVMCHDASLNRTFKNAADYTAISGTVTINQNTLATLRANYVLASNNVRMRRPIPTLDEYLRTCRDTGQFPLVELKDTTNYTNADALAVLNQCKRILGEGNFAIECFNPALLDYLRTVSTKTPLYYLYDTAPTLAQMDNIQANNGVLFAYTGIVTDALMADCRNRGIKVAAWTVANTQYDSLAKLGLDEYCTDTLAPALINQLVIFRDFSESAFASYANQGTLADGIVTLAQGQKLTLTNPAALRTVDLGAWYSGFGLKGTVTVTGANFTLAESNTGDDWGRFNHQCLMYLQAASLVFTAGVGGCQIKDVSFAVASC